VLILRCGLNFDVIIDLKVIFKGDLKEKTGKFLSDALLKFDVFFFF
jgi:hypothetical protein